MSGRRFLWITAFLPNFLMGAALVAVPGPPKIPDFLEANRGQARSDVRFLSRSTLSSFGITAQSVIYSPLDVTLSFVGSNAGAEFTTPEPLPGFVNVYSGADSRKWVQKAPLYSTATAKDVYPGIDAQYLFTDAGLVLRFVCRPGCDMSQPLLALSRVTRLNVDSNGTLEGWLGIFKMDARITYPRATAYQGNSTVPLSYDVRGTDRFGFRVSSYDSSAPLYVEMTLGATQDYRRPTVLSATDEAGNVYVAAGIPDAAGKDAPFPDSGQVGCGSGLFYTPIACRDAAVYKFSAAGDLLYATYLAGRTSEAPGALTISPTGAVIVAGATDSSDFPVTANAYQSNYAGPNAAFSRDPRSQGDLFAVALDPATGAPIGSTFVGGPDGDAFDRAYVGSDGSVYLFPSYIGQGSPSARLPVTAGALQPACAGDPCASSWVIRLGPSLDRAVYATYLPGITWVTALHADGSLYFAGRAGSGFPVTAGTYQTEPKGSDAFVARLDPSGTKLLFGTYFGTGKNDTIYTIAVAPNGEVWADVSSFLQCCTSEYTLIRLDATGSKLLFTKPYQPSDLAVDRDGNLLSLSVENATVSPDALLAHGCGPLLRKMKPSGEQVFATYLPARFLYSFSGFSKAGNPLFTSYPYGESDTLFELIPSQPAGVFTGCVASSGNYGFINTVSPGELVSIFGSGLGPREGAAYELQGGKIPSALGGTRVLLNGEAIPLLYASYWQVNAIVPYNPPMSGLARVQVETKEGTSNEVTLLPQKSGVALFTADGTGTGQAAALNEDGTANSPGNPAKPGSVVMLFGTGGGTTTPPGLAGEVTPLEQRPLDATITVTLGQEQLRALKAAVEYAGAAPGLAAGVIQINVRLPEIIPNTPEYPRSAIPMNVTIDSDNSPNYPWATIAVK